MSPTARRLVFAAKMLISIGAFAFVLGSVDWTALVSHWSRPSWLLVSFTFAIFAVQFPISAYKWRQSLRAHRLEYPFLFLLRVLSIGFFFNNFLPTSIGGDAYRVLRTVPADGSKSRALSAIVLERVVGFSALLSLGFLGSLAITFRTHSALADSFVRLTGLGVLAAGVAYLLMRFGHSSRPWEWAARQPKLRALMESGRLIAHSRRPMVALVFWSLVFQSLAVLAIFSLFDAVGEPIDFASCAVIGTMSALVAVLPISINGIGISESSFVAVAVALGATTEHSAAVAILIRVLVAPLSLGCGLIYMAELHLPSVEDLVKPTD
jgi:glycosyltransferase 2 family protein